MNRAVVEICVESPEAALAAQFGGADRVELCGDLTDGGTTPSFGAIARTRELLSIKLHIIIRPRGGDFLYSEIEIDTMRRDIEAAKTLGVDGVVFGFLDADGNIDAVRTREFADLARPMSVTFHRAFDAANDPSAALEELIACGVDRVLTSGQKNLAAEGVELLKALVEQAGERIVVMVCGSLRPDNIRSIVAAANAKEVHFTAFTPFESEMRYRNDVRMGGSPPDSEYIRNVTDAELVRATIDAI